MPTTIILIDDHELILDGLAQLVEGIGGFQILAKAGNGKAGLDLVEKLAPDIVLMDVDMPVMNGLEATQQIKKLYPKVRIIILTMHGDPALIKRMMEIGADGFLLKNSNRDEFREALTRVAQGKTYFSSDAAQAVISGKSVTPGNFVVGNDTILLSTLSDRETEILKNIALGKSNKEIGDQLFISHRTVDTHRTNIMKKMGVHNVAGLVRIALRNGLVQE